MREAEANARLEDDWRPVEFYHIARRLRWTVREVLDGWTHPGWPGKTYKKPVAEKRYRLRVFGPLPGRPDQLGEFVMIATAYGNRERWWIRPQTHQEGPAGLGQRWLFERRIPQVCLTVTLPVLAAA
jgi:hypothetical protein